MPVNTILIDPADPDVLYVGTDLGVWWGTPEGVWTPYSDGLPVVAVFDLAAEPNSGLLVASTHGGRRTEVLEDRTEIVAKGRLLFGELQIHLRPGLDFVASARERSNLA